MFDQDRHFDFFQYQRLVKDFCYLTPLGFHFSSQNANSKCEIDQSIQFKSSKCILTDAIQIEKSFSEEKKLRVKASNNFLKVHYRHLLPKRADNDQVQVQMKDEEKITIYGTSFADRKVQNASLQLGMQRQTENSLINANLTAFLYQHKNEYFLYTKILHMAKTYNIGFLSIFDLACKNLQTNDLILELKPHPNHQIFLRGQVEGLRNYSLKYSKISSYFDFLTTNYIFAPSDSLTLMAEMIYDVNAKKMKHIESLIQKRFPDKKFKMKINNLADITLQLKFPLKVGSVSSVDFGCLLADLFNSRRISYGFRVNLNY